jgi:hypothetical protein
MKIEEILEYLRCSDELRIEVFGKFVLIRPTTCDIDTAFEIVVRKNARLVYKRKFVVGKCHSINRIV